MKFANKSRKAICLALKKVFQQSIERIQTLADADLIENEVLRARKGNIFSDAEAYEMLTNINKIREILKEEKNKCVKQ